MTSKSANETGRVEAFSDGVFAIAITLLILEIRVPTSDSDLGGALLKLWPSYLAFLSSFLTIGIMWLNHHRLLTLIHKCDDTLIVINLLLLLGVTWTPFPTALLAQHLRGPAYELVGALYAGSFVAIAVVYNLMWRYAVKMRLVVDHLDVDSITRQYMLGPLMYGVLVMIAYWSGTAVLVVATLYALYFALPPRLFQRRHA